jgi:hypothetical protein
VQLAYQHLPIWLQQGVVEWNKGSFVLENNSRILAAATSADNIRGYSINLLFIDEAAHIENWDEFFTSTLPTISSGKTTKIVLVSTPLGLNHFHKIWKHANLPEGHEEKNEYNPIKVTWSDVPGRDINWYNKTLSDLNFDIERFDQEFNVEFLGSSGTLISGKKLRELTDRMPIRYKDGFRQYIPPVRERSYAIVADVSRGRNLDYSAFSVIDITEMPYVQVAAYSDNLVLPADYADIIHHAGKLYNDALVLVETNDIGEMICDRLYYDYEYINMVQTENSGSQGKRISQGFGRKHTDRGVRTTQRVKNIGCSILKMLVEQEQLITHDKQTHDEFKTFSKKNKSYEAEPGKHDDLVMGLVLFAWMTDQAFFKDYNGLNTMNKLREKTDEEIMNDLVPFGIIYDGREEDPNIIDDGSFPTIINFE